MTQIDAGSLQTGDEFVYQNMRFKVTANNGALYIEAKNLQSNVRVHIEHDEDVEVPCDDE